MQIYDIISYNIINNRNIVVILHKERWKYNPAQNAKGLPLKYTQQDKARILRITTRTLQRWRTTKPELYALIEAGFKMREKICENEKQNAEIENLIKTIDADLIDTKG